MYCTKCGTALEETYRYCWNCGKPNQPGVPPADPPPVDPAKSRLVRPVAGRQIAGVCIGFARYFDVDVTLMRIIWLVVAIFTGVGFIAYLIAWIAMPNDYTVPAPVPAGHQQSA
jgi:phage shock protein C